MCGDHDNQYSYFLSRLGSSKKIICALELHVIPWNKSIIIYALLHTLPDLGELGGHQLYDLIGLWQGPIFSIGSSTMNVTLREVWSEVQELAVKVSPIFHGALFCIVDHSLT